MAAAKEEAEWWRLSNLIAFLANKLRFGAGPTVKAEDICPYSDTLAPAPEPKSVKDKMDEFWAANPNMPLRVIRYGEDGRVVEIEKVK